MHTGYTEATIDDIAPGNEVYRKTSKGDYKKYIIASTAPTTPTEIKALTTKKRLCGYEPSDGTTPIMCNVKHFTITFNDDTTKVLAYYDVDNNQIEIFKNESYLLYKKDIYDPLKPQNNNSHPKFTNLGIVPTVGGKKSRRRTRQARRQKNRRTRSRK